MKPVTRSRRRSAAVARISVPRVKVQAVAARAERNVVPLNQRRLNFGSRWDYAPAPEDYKYIVIAPRHELFIGGKCVRPHSEKYFPSVNPATEETLTEIAAGDATDVDKAVKAARRAYERVWSKMPERERGKYLYRIRASARRSHVNGPCSKPWTAGSPSGKAAM